MLTTRQRLVQAAAQGFAEHGIRTASLVEITRQAGQRNRGAVHYHFGTREGLLAAVLDEHTDFMAARQGELLARALEQPGDQVAAVVEVIVRSCVEVASLDEGGSCYLKIIAELSEHDPETYTPEVEAALVRSGGYEVYAVLMDRVLAAVEGLDETLRDHRILLMTAFVLGSAARRVRGIDAAAEPDARPQLEAEAFIAELVAMATAMLLVPAPEDASRV